MKSLFTFSLFFITCHAFGQSTLTGANTNPQVGESFITYSDDGSTIYAPGNGGANATWNFPTINLAEQDTAIYVACGSTPECGYFSGSNLAVSYSGDSGYSYLSATSGSLVYVGDYETGEYGDTDMLSGYTALQYPFTYNSNFNTNYSGHGFSYGADPYNDYYFGSQTVVCDGYGTITTPAGTFQNVLRIHTAEIETDSLISSSGTSVSHDTTDAYDWYMPGFHGSLYEIYIEDGDTSNSYNTQLTTGVPKVNNLEATIELYPNPAKELFNMKFNIAEKETVSIIMLDMLGRQIAIIANNTYDAGSHQLSYNTASLPKGMYLVQLKSNTGTVTRKIEIM